MPADRLIDCHRCLHYFVTWEKGRPHGCKAMGFKSGEMPSRVVLNTSGSHCLRYEPKRSAKKKNQ